jgi:hypothetical protein|tara:strand:+ start:115 stop:450 length:336 start_codon:yes stop_codon:yes gene_type:complete
MPHIDFEIKQNDTQPPLEFVLRDANRNLVNLTGATVQFSMRAHPAGTTKVSLQSCTLVEAVAGRGKYPWAAANTDTADVYEGEIKVTFADGGLQRFPGNGYIIITVKDDVA